METGLKEPKDPRGDLKKATQEEVMQAAERTDLEAHRLLEVVREAYCRGDLGLVDTGGLLRDLEQTGLLLRRQRRAFLAPPAAARSLQDLKIET